MIPQATSYRVAVLKQQNKNEKVLIEIKKSKTDTFKPFFQKA